MLYVWISTWEFQFKYFQQAQNTVPQSVFIAGLRELKKFRQIIYMWLSLAKYRDQWTDILPVYEFYKIIQIFQVIISQFSLQVLKAI